MPSPLPSCLQVAIFVMGMLFVGSALALDCQNATTTLDMNECAAREQKAVELNLNQTYQKALKHLQQADTETEKYSAMRQKLIEAQRAWIKFREADCQSVYLQSGAGSIRNLMFTGCMQKHAERRIEDLTAVFSEP